MALYYTTLEECIQAPALHFSELFYYNQLHIDGIIHVTLDAYMPTELKIIYNYIMGVKQEYVHACMCYI